MDLLGEIGKSVDNLLQTDLSREIAILNPYFKDTLVGPLVPFFTFLLAIVLNEKRAPKTTKNIRDEYDYIIVGAGSGGATLAARLSEESCVSVLLLEAGGPAPMLSELPQLSKFLQVSDMDWAFYTVPQKYTALGIKNQSVAISGGKVFGGSSVINQMLFTRGHDSIYDEWVMKGAEGWGAQDLLKYFKRLEDNQNPELVEQEYHGYKGPVTVTKPDYNTHFKPFVGKSFADIGFHPIDVNGRFQRGLYDYQSTTRNGQRCSVAKAYLVPAENRKNLHIKQNALATKVLIEENRAKGVIFEHSGKKYKVLAKKEVIVSAGAINTPKLLMLSGIGPEKHLKEMGIPVKVNLTGVGQNFRDHTAAIASYYTDKLLDFSNRMIFNFDVIKYLFTKTGTLSSSQVEYMAFLTNNRSASKDAIPDYELYFTEGVLKVLQRAYNINDEVYNQVYRPYEKVASYWCLSQNLRSRSHGFVKLNSKDPHDPPLIDPQYFSHPQDRIDTVEGLRECHRIMRSEHFRKLGVKPYATLYPGCEDYAGNQTAYLTCQVTQFLITICHPSGTAKMGNTAKDDMAVVDKYLKIKGIENMRVVDASIFPTIPVGNTNAPTIVVAEKAADIIKDTIKCDSKQKKPS